MTSEAVSDQPATCVKSVHELSPIILLLAAYIQNSDQINTLHRENTMLTIVTEQMQYVRTIIAPLGMLPHRCSLVVKRPRSDPSCLFIYTQLFNFTVSFRVSRDLANYIELNTGTSSDASNNGRNMLQGNSGGLWLAAMYHGIYRST